MLKPAFSTVACPEWTLDRVAMAAGRMGYLGVELRTFDVSSRRFACDPALTDPAKVRRLFADHGVQVCSIATDASFDAMVIPPVVGHLFTDEEVEVRKAERAIDLAASIEAPYVRVFGFRQSAIDSRKTCVGRIAGRLAKVIDHARNSGVTVLIENGGSFATSSEVLEIVEAINSPLLRVCYSASAASIAGENLVDGFARLDGKAPVIRLRDLRDGKPVALGTGTIPSQPLVAAAAKAASGSTDAWSIFEWDRAWLPEIGEPEFALEHAVRTMFQWIGQAAPTANRPAITASVY